MLINYIIKDKYKICEIKEKRLDALNDEDFKNAVITAAETVDILLLDMTDVDFMDSSAIAALVHIYKVFKQQNKRLILIGLSKRVLTIFELTGVSDFFEIYPTMEDFNGKAKI